MGKHLILKFDGAKLFRKTDRNNVNLPSKDNVIVSHRSYEKRDVIPSFVEPITVHQISNMIHVLFNERPVPSLRRCYYSKILYYFNKAKDSYIRIDTPKVSRYIDKQDYYYETTTVKKALENSYNTNVYVNWEIVKNYIGDEAKFITFVNKLDELLKIKSQTIPFVEVREKVKSLLTKDEKLDLYAVITDLKNIKGLVDYFGAYKADNNGVYSFNKSIDCALTQKNSTSIVVNSGIEKAAVLYGEILVPVSEDDIKKLKSSKGCANLLDGGLVWIHDVIDDEDLSTQGYTLVGSISDKKTTPNKNK